jgi:hypothetical protein
MHLVLDPCLYSTGDLKKRKLYAVRFADFYQANGLASHSAQGITEATCHCKTFDRERGYRKEKG